MILDNQCNMVYISALLPKACPSTYLNLTRALNKYDVKYSFLDSTNDIWCRDFMPIQLDLNYFEGYMYDPDYLQNSDKDRATITDGNKLCRRIGFKVGSALNSVRIDGGNIVKAPAKIIMTSKVFEENPTIIVSELSKKIENTYGVKLIIMPWDSEEIFGHSDGICRYVGNDTILMTNYSQIDIDMSYRFKRSLLPHFKKVEELEFKVKKPYKNNWAYINWLQTDRVLILPRFNVPEDEQAFEQISKLMPEYEGCIEMIDATDLVIHGGALNCCTWTIRQ